MRRIRLGMLELVCRRSVEVIEFKDLSYVFGEIGTGKSTVARLVDYALGGTIVITPALQSEIVEVTLHLTVNDTACVFTRARESEQVRATWGPEGYQSQLIIPARPPAGVPPPGTEVSVLSVLLLHLTGL